MADCINDYTKQLEALHVERWFHFHRYHRHQNTLKVVGTSIQQFIPIQPCIMSLAHVKDVGMHAVTHTTVIYAINVSTTI